MYVCRACDVGGRDLEVSPGRVPCWYCGDDAAITARITVAPLA